MAVVEWLLQLRLLLKSLWGMLTDVVEMLVGDDDGDSCVGE